MKLDCESSRGPLSAFLPSTLVYAYILTLRITFSLPCNANPWSSNRHWLAGSRPSLGAPFFGCRHGA